MIIENFTKHQRNNVLLFKSIFFFFAPRKSKTTSVNESLNL